MVAQRAEVGRPVLAVDQHEVMARHREHLDQLLGRHPHQGADQPVPGVEPLPERGKATDTTDGHPSSPSRAGSITPSPVESAASIQSNRSPP